MINFRYSQTTTMPYRCQQCMNTFKTLTLYNKHAASGPNGGCNVEVIEVAKPSTVTTIAVKRDAQDEQKNISDL